MKSLPSGLPKLIQGPSAWYGSKLVSSREWIYHLTDEEIVEVERAVQPHLDADTDIAQITGAQFALPNLAPKIARIKRELLDGRGFAVLRGLPVNSWSTRQSAIAFFGLGCHIGNARSQNSMGHLLGHVRDLGRDALTDPTARTYQTRQRQTFHTDDCDIVGLLCLRTAKSGGTSALVSSMTIYNEMIRRRPDLVPEMFGPMYTDRRGEVPAGENPWHEIPVYSWFDGYLSALYSRRYIESARRFSQIAPLTEQQVAALDLFDELANDTSIGIRMQFEPGDLQFLHNHTILHDRTAYEDWPEPDRKRHLLRLWLAAPGARPLPPVYKQRWGKTEIGDRGGIIVPGTKLCAPLDPC